MTTQRLQTAAKNAAKEEESRKIKRLEEINKNGKVIEDDNEIQVDTSDDDEESDESENEVSPAKPPIQIAAVNSGGATARTIVSKMSDSSLKKIRELREENLKLRREKDQLEVYVAISRRKNIKLDPLTLSNIRSYVNRTVFEKVKFIKGMEVPVMKDLMVNHLNIPIESRQRFLECYTANMQKDVDEARQNVQKVARGRFLSKLLESIKLLYDYYH
jgi:hypothetical protein